jgi:hypothetical protein
MNASSSPWASSLSRLLLFATLLCPFGPFASAQAAGADYTNDLPSVERIKTELKGADESDTLARQEAIFTYLVTYIDRIKSSRSFRGPYTPGELNMRNAYSLAAYQIAQDYKKTHTPAQVSAWSLQEGRYEINNALDWIHQLSGAQSNAAYHNAESVYHASAKKMYNQQMRENEEAQQRAQAAGSAPGSGGMSNDPGSLAIRRCLELGGSQLQCLGKGLGTGFLDLTGMTDSPLLKGPSYTGLTLTGNFKSGNGIYAQFADTSVGLGNCGKLIIGSLAYSIQRNGSEILIHVKNSPASFTLALAPDGKLQGPPSAQIAGKVITGYQKVWVADAPKAGYFQTQTTTNNQELTPLEANQYAGQSGLTQNGQMYNMATTSTSSTYVPGSAGGGHYQSVPIYAPKTQTCSIGTLAPGPPEAVDQGMVTNLASFTGMLFGQSSNSGGNSGQEMLAPGIRLAGLYDSAGGLTAQFADADVIFDCGQAHVRDKYTLEQSGPRILVHVQHPGSPFTVLVQPDGSLSGPASVTVAGRLVSGMDGNRITYTPRTETCSLGILSPAGSGAASKPAITASAATPQPPLGAAPPTAASAAVPAPASVSSSPAPARASFRVLIHAQFPGDNPLAGQHVFVMRERLDEALRKLGLPLPQGATPVQALGALAAACQRRDCKPIYTALAQHFVASTTLDAGGKATLSATAMTGSYYFFATARTANGPMMWDLPVNLVAGDNTVALNSANAEALGK